MTQYNLRQRLDGPEETAFIFDLYASTRAEEFAVVDWKPGELEQILQFQFQAQEHAYQHEYPGCTDQVIEVDGQPAGRLLTWRDADTICLLDIALLPAYRGYGIGTQLVKSVMAQGDSEGRRVWLYVMFNNPRAEKLYTSLGFTRREQVGAFYIMDWLPPSAVHA